MRKRTIEVFMKTEENKNELNELYECYKYGIEQFDRLQISISAMALGWYITILDIKTIDVCFVAVLYKIAIAAFGITLILSITNHFSSARIAYKEAFNIINNKKNKRVLYHNIVKYFNVIILISIIVGIASTIAIGFINVK